MSPGHGADDEASGTSSGRGRLARCLTPRRVHLVTFPTRPGPSLPIPIPPVPRLGTRCPERGVWHLVVPGPDPIRVPLAYPIARHDQALAAFVDTWIALKRKDGTLDAAYKHWILGQDAARRQPRWSIVRNVLHWVK